MSEPDPSTPRSQLQAALRQLETAPEISYPPNEPIELGVNRIVRVGDDTVDLPVRIVQNLWPLSCVDFVVDGSISNTPLQDDPFRIEIEGDYLPIDTRVRLMRLYPIVTTLIPVLQPCPSVHLNTRISSASFLVLNAPNFLGGESKWVRVGNGAALHGAATVVTDSWRVSIEASRNLTATLNTLKESDGVAVTHVGRVTQTNGDMFTLADALSVIGSVRLALSFCRGAKCGIAVIRGTTDAGSDIPVQWGTWHTTPWSTSSKGCAPTMSGFDMFATIATTLLERRTDTDFCRVVDQAIDWYTISNCGPAHAGIIVSQAALELLCSYITGKRIKPGIPASQVIRAALNSCRTSIRLPKSWPASRKWDGPGAFVNTRNDFVHAQPRHFVTFEEQFCAWDLGQWYIEVLLMSLLGYVGDYHRRLQI